MVKSEFLKISLWQNFNSIKSFLPFFRNKTKEFFAPKTKPRRNLKDIQLIRHETFEVREFYRIFSQPKESKIKSSLKVLSRKFNFRRAKRGAQKTMIES